ncbi:MAG: hypothetical protein ACRD1R_17345 [Acidobacteriota bacterium]
MRLITLVCGVIFLSLLFSPAPAGGFAVALQSEADQARDAFLAADAAAAAFMALLDHPEALEDRRVQMKVFRSLSAREPEIAQAALALTLRASQLGEAAMIKRRLDMAFIGPNVDQKAAILDIARNNPQLLQDLRVISLISDSLQTGSPLQDTALSILESEPSLLNYPAIAAALVDLPGQADQVTVKLPEFQAFKEKVEPVYQKMGADDKSCVSCHKTHPIMQLLPLEEAQSEDAMLKQHYRSALRVVNLQEPETSLILVKPTVPEPPQGTHSASPQTHGGGVRWQKGSPQYQAILDWIQTADR